MKTNPTIAVVLLVMALASCGTGDAPIGGASPGDGTPTSPQTRGEPTTPAAGCEAAGTQLEIEAEDIAFDADCLAVPAGVPFTVEMKNRDESVAHNFAIYTQDGEPVFKPETFQGRADKIYTVEPLEAGTYRFQCDVHPGLMNGTFIAG